MSPSILPSGSVTPHGVQCAPPVPTRPCVDGSTRMVDGREDPVVFPRGHESQTGVTEDLRRGGRGEKEGGSNGSHILAQGHCLKRLYSFFFFGTEL